MGRKEYKYPVVQVKPLPSYELPITGGIGTKFIKVIGAIVIIISRVSLIRKKINV